MKGRFLTEKDMKGSEHKLPYMSKFDALVEVCRVASELYDQENKTNESSNVKAFDIEKSWGKRPVRGDHDQESSKTAWGSSRTCWISGKELFKGGRKRFKGESSSGYRRDELGNVGRSGSGLDRGKKRKYYGFEDFENYGKKEKVLGKKRTYCGPKDEDFEYSVKKKKPRNNTVRVRTITAPLPGEFAAEILRLGGNDVKLLIQKKITATDLNPSENRFSIPVNQVREEGKDFLTKAEKKILNRRTAGNGIVPIPVRVLDTKLRRSYINFKKWPINTSFSYVLCGSWTVVQQSNNLEADTEIQVWSFRVNGKLNLALVKVPKI